MGLGHTHSRRDATPSSQNTWLRRGKRLGGCDMADVSHPRIIPAGSQRGLGAEPNPCLGRGDSGSPPRCPPSQQAQWPSSPAAPSWPGCGWHGETWVRQALCTPVKPLCGQLLAPGLPGALELPTEERCCNFGFQESEVFLHTRVHTHKRQMHICPGKSTRVRLTIATFGKRSGEWNREAFVE